MARTSCGRGVATTEKKSTRKKAKHHRFVVFALFVLLFFSFSVFFALPASAKTVTVVHGDAKKPTKSTGSHAKTTRSVASKSAEFSLDASAEAGDGKQDAARSIDENRIVDINEVHANSDADALSSSAGLNTHASQLSSLAAPFEDTYQYGDNFNADGNPTPFQDDGWGEDIKEWTKKQEGSYIHPEFGLPGVSVSNDICIVEGVIGRDWYDFKEDEVLVTLPEKCRPERRVVFNVANYDEDSTRVDVFPNGEVKYIAGVADQNFLSLTGIKFVTKEFKGTKKLLDLNVDAFKNYDDNTFEDAFSSKINGECILGGSIKRQGSKEDIAQLPEECRPKKKLIFNVGTYECNMYMEILSDGKMVAKGDFDDCDGPISLSGISFITKDSNVSLVDLGKDLKNGWKAYNDEGPSYALMGGECIVQGSIKGESWDHIATLPVECRPHKKLAFNLNNNGYPSRVFVLTNGEVRWINGEEEEDWLSLSGIRFIAVPKDAIHLTGHWQPYGEEWGIPTYKVQDEVCEVLGRIRGAKKEPAKVNDWGLLASLPSECRPEKNTIFSVNNDEYSARIEVLSSGDVKYKDGGKPDGIEWLSLTGIKFVTKEGKSTKKPLDLKVGAFENYGEDYEDAFYSKINGECVLGGSIKKISSSWEVAQLPEECRPEKALAFIVGAHGGNMYMEILGDGKIVAKGEFDNSKGPISLNGISFIPKDSKASSVALASSLESNWKTYDGGEAPSYTVIKDDCIVQGLIQGESSDHIATLPVDCRPYKRLTFNLNYDKHSAGVDVLKNGKVLLMGGGRASRDWFSLSGIRFEVEQPPPPKVTIGNPWSQLALEEFDFDIRVHHDICGKTSSCFADTAQVDTNVASGLKCEVFVKLANDESCTYKDASTHLPCKKWDNFFEKSKSPAELRPYLSLTDKDGKVATGEYEIWYDCFHRKKSARTGTGLKKLHEFRVIDKCADFLPPGFESLSIAELVLHSAPSFLELKHEDCNRVDAVKESIFRKYDTTPQDGRLDENEVLEALLQHDVDTSSLAYLIPESNHFRKKGGIMLGDFMVSSALPLLCSGSLTESSDVYFTAASYPTIESKYAQCEADKEGVKLKWDYKLTPQEGDRQCLYTDGRLLRSFKTDASGTTVTSFRDKRPSSGVGPDAVTLHVHMSFDSGMVENLIKNSSVILEEPDEEDARVTAEHCVTKDSDGGKCFKRITVSSTVLELSNKEYMSKSSIMTWIKFADVPEEDQYFWQSVEFESNFKKAFGIRKSGKVFARLNNDVQVEGNTTLQVNQWYHVAMVLNKGSGIEIFVNGDLDNALKSSDNAQMDFPIYPSKVRVLDAVGLYDDFRIYTGVVTKLHISSIYSCGRQQSCAILAHATPQSRRVYCMVPKYNTRKSSKGFVPPCIVGLFYTGAAMDLQLTPSQKGILFSFRDTALEETSYEILRRPRDPILGPMGDYKAVVMIDTALDFCATTFSSLTFFDDEAIREPGSTWEYAVKTKFRELTLISDPREFKTPFFALFEGAVVAGNAGVGIPNIRVCTRVVKRSDTNLPRYDTNADDSNLAAYKYAWRSELKDADKQSSAFKITDQDDTSFSEVKPNEWFTVSLSLFSRISRVNVCTEQEESQFDVRVLDYQDPNDKGDMGSMCILSLDEVGSPSVFTIGNSTCRSYSCSGTSVPAYFGKSVTVRSTSNAASYKVSEVQVMGVEVDCPYTTFSDEDGNFEIDILDVTGVTPKNSYIGTLAIKTDIYDEIDTLMLNATSQTKPEALLIAIAVDEVRFEENWEKSPDVTHTKAVVGKDEFISYCKERTKFSGAHFVLQEKVWTFIDRDGSGDLNEIEFANVMRAFHGGYIYAVPWVVYPTISTRHMTQFRAAYQDEKKKNALFSLVPLSKAVLPSSQESWQKWVHEMEKTFPTFDMDMPHDKDISGRTSLTNMGIGDSSETKIYAVPMATFPTTKFISLRQVMHADEIHDFAHEEHGILKEMFTSPVEVHAIQRLPDVEHVFGEGTEKVLPIKHLGAAGEDFEDNTAVTISGMVRFPGSRTQDVLCGLQSATIYAYEGKKCNGEELAKGLCSPKGYKYEFEPVSYMVDGTGRFDISITPGETWLFIASSDGHDLCYGGDAVDVLPCSVRNAPPIKLSEKEFDKNTYHELENVIGGEFLTYFDVTSRQVDLGLYAGACDTPYTKYSLLITPANGCGAPIELSDTEIVGSWPLVDSDNTVSNVRLWPYAAMDYNIELLQAPDVTALTEDKILSEYTGASCKKGSQNIMNFFRERHLLVQTIPLLERTFGEARFEYHDWFCVEPTFGNLPETSLKTPFTSIRPEEICIGSDAAKHDLTKKHLIGTSNMEYSKLGSQLSPDKFVSLKVVEAHYTAPNTISYCSMFERSVNDAPTKLTVKVRIHQDVAPQGSNPCHSSNEPSEKCVFTKVDATSRLLQFQSGEGKDGNSYEISSKGAVPNLVPPHRRKFLARVERNDGWAVTNIAIERELITLASKKRGGGNDPEARYQSGTEFYATAPIRGLVYTVVHDPPGGNSVASISQGTNINLEFGLANTRALSMDTNRGGGAGFAIGLGFKKGTSAGSRFVNVEIEMDDEVKGGTEIRHYLANKKKIDIQNVAEDKIKSMMSANKKKIDMQNAVKDKLKSMVKNSEEEKGKEASPSEEKDEQSETKGTLGFETGHNWFTASSGPSVDLSATIEDGWDFSFTLDRTISSSEEPGLAGRPGDTILGGGFEIVYVLVDGVDIRDNCLKVIGEVQWFPRQPTSYLLSVHDIEKKVIPDLEGLIAKAKDKESIMTDGEMDDKSNDEVKAIWKHRLETSIDDWKRTLEWSSPDFNPEGLLKLSEAKQKEKLTQIQTKYDQTTVPFNSDDSVFGRLMKPKIVETNDMYTTDLLQIWDLFDDNKEAGEGLVTGSRTLMTDTLSSKNHSWLESWEMKYNDNQAMNNQSWLESWEMMENDNQTMKNVFTSVENNSTEALFSRGMSDLAENDMKNRANMTHDDKFFKYDAAARYVDASVFGSKASFGFGGKNQKDSKLNPIASGSDQSIYLTFSGGGQALEFSSDVSSAIDGISYSWALESGSSSEQGYSSETSLGPLTGSGETGSTTGTSRASEHAMAWAKHGNLAVSYSLGDPDPYDKFVVAVSTDKRFGTPIFKTIGGASKCPGEPNTLWRESGMMLETAWAAGVNNKFIHPGQNALFDIIITNESPFREGLTYGLKLISDPKFNGDFAENMLDLSFTVNGVDKLAPYSSASFFLLDDIQSVDEDGNLKRTRLSLNVAKGKFAQSYSSIGVQIVSECEFPLEFYRDPISSSAYLGDFKWERECPKVMWDETTYNTYLNTIISKNTSPVINMTLLNPDPLNLWSEDYVEGDSKQTNYLVHPNVEFVRVQWRKLGQGEWMNSWDMVGDNPDIWKRDVKDADVQCKFARGKGCAFKWNTERQHFLSGLKDGTWEVRAKVFCSGYDSFATSEVKASVTEENLNVVVDVTSPAITSVSVYNRTVTIDYSEPVICPQLTVDHMSYTIERIETCEGDSVQSGLVSSSEVFSHYQFSCLAGQRGTIMAKWPKDAESGIYKLTVNADKLGPMVTDFALNPGSFGEQISGIKVGCDSGKDSLVKLGDKLSRNKSSVSASEAKGRKKLRAAHIANRESTLGAAAPRSSKPIFLSFNELPVKFDSKLVVVTSIFAMMFVALAWRKRAASKATVSVNDNNLESEKRSFLDEDERRIGGKGGETYGAVL